MKFTTSEGLFVDFTTSEGVSMYFTRSEGVSVSCTWLLTLAAQHIAELSLGVDVQQQILDRVGQDRPALSWTLLGLEGLH